MKRKATEDASRDQEKKKSKKQTSFSDIISSLKQRLAEEQNTIPGRGQQGPLIWKFISLYVFY